MKTLLEIKDILCVYHTCSSVCAHTWGGGGEKWRERQRKKERGKDTLTDRKTAKMRGKERGRERPEEN